jgi:hypothetical protein
VAEGERTRGRAGNGTVTYRFRFGYERDAGRYVGEGRDFWVPHRGDGGWLATHRVVPEMAERAAE